MMTDTYESPAETSRSPDPCPLSPPCPGARIHLIGREAIRADVAAAIDLAIADHGPGPGDGGKRWSVRQLAIFVYPHLQLDTIDGILYEGILQTVRRVKRLRDREANKEKQKRGSRGQGIGMAQTR